MSSNPEIERLRGESDRAFGEKQRAYGIMKNLGQKRFDLKSRLDASWENVSSARNEMNTAYEGQQRDWESYQQERQSLSNKIDEVAAKADRAHQAMKDCFDRADTAYNSGNKAEAPRYSQEGKGYKLERDGYNNEKAILISRAKMMTPPRGNFHHYKSLYDAAMRTHKSLQDEYRAIKSQHESAQNDFNLAKERFETAKETLRQSIAKERATWREEKCKECGNVIHVNIEWRYSPRYCKNCKEKFLKQQQKIANAAGKKADEVKIRFNPATGKNDIYFGGIGDADSYGHGHAVVDERGSLHYLREVTLGDRKDAVVLDDKMN